MQVKEVVLETAEDDIEEIPHLPGLPNVVRRDDGGAKQTLSFMLSISFLFWPFLSGEMMGGKKSAFTESSSFSSETEEEGSLELGGGGDIPLSQRPPSSRFLLKHPAIFGRKTLGSFCKLDSRF